MYLKDVIAENTCVCSSVLSVSYMCVLMVPSPAAARSRSPQAQRPGGLLWPYEAGYVEQPCWVGWASSAACRSSHSRCQSLGWWCHCHIFSSAAKHYLLLIDKVRYQSCYVEMFLFLSRTWQISYTYHPAERWVCEVRCYCSIYPH